MLEELMGLFGGMEAPADDPRRRRGGRMGTGYEGIGGGQVSISQLLPHLFGLPTYDFSGPMFRGIGDMLGARPEGPAARHFERQGGQFDAGGPPQGQPFQQPQFLPPGQGGAPPGLDTRNPIGGPNIAPGEVTTGRAINQPPGAAIGQMIPRTQGWRNLAPGGAVAAAFGYGTDAFGKQFGVGGPPRGPAAESGGPPGVRAPEGGGGAGGGKGGLSGAGGAGPTNGPAPLQGPGGGTPAFGGGGPAAPAGGGGGGGPGATGGGGRGGGGRNPQPGPRGGRPGGRGGRTGGGGGIGGPRPGQANAVRPGGEQRGPQGAKGTTVQDVVGGGFNQVGGMIADVFGPGGRPAADANPNSSGTTPTRNAGGPRQGRNNGGRRNKPGMYAGETNQERQQRLAAKSQRQEARAAREARIEARQAQQAAAATAAAGRPVNMTPASSASSSSSGQPRRNRNRNTGTSLIGGPQI